jgi:hypothetical protein
MVLLGTKEYVEPRLDERFDELLKKYDIYGLVTCLRQNCMSVRFESKPLEAYAEVRPEAITRIGEPVITLSTRLLDEELTSIEILTAIVLHELGHVFGHEDYFILRAGNIVPELYADMFVVARGYGTYLLHALNALMVGSGGEIYRKRIAWVEVLIKTIA